MMMSSSNNLLKYNPERETMDDGEEGKEKEKKKKKNKCIM